MGRLEKQSMRNVLEMNPSGFATTPNNYNQIPLYCKGSMKKDRTPFFYAKNFIAYS